jgi:diguanylate cyclase (GGDEF)-like protein
MRVGETRPGRNVVGTRREREAAGSYASSQNLSVSAPTDSASVMGIPEGELTPKVRDAIMTLMQEVERLRSDLERATTRLAHLEQLADQDTLIPIPNRRAFVRELGRVISYSQRYETDASLIYIDVNDFKDVNDEHGHAAGDAALIHIARNLMDRLRESDLIGRLGGDEFGIILSNADGARANEKAKELADVVAAAPVEFDGQQFNVTISYGVTTFGAGESVSDAIAAADKAMYEFKAARGKV